MLTGLVVLAILGMALAAWCDLMTRRIPNLLCLAIAVLFGVATLFSPLQVSFVDGLMVALPVLVVTFAAFAHGSLGAGDAKLMTVCALWAGTGHAMDFLLVTGLTGGLMALIALMTPLRVSLGHLAGVVLPESMSRGLTATGLPYGLAIATGGVYVLTTRFLV
ncbi:A24 family peptidase [Rhodovibrionaceae bacterium A322]